MNEMTVRENTRAQIRVIVKRILLKYGLSPRINRKKPPKPSGDMQKLYVDNGGTHEW